MNISYPNNLSGKKPSSTSIKQLIEKIRVIPQLDGGPGMTDTSSESEIDDDEDPLNRFASFEGNEKTECDEVIKIKFERYFFKLILGC